MDQAVSEKLLNVTPTSSTTTGTTSQKSITTKRIKIRTKPTELPIDDTDGSDDQDDSEEDLIIDQLADDEIILANGWSPSKYK